MSLVWNWFLWTENTDRFWMSECSQIILNKQNKQESAAFENASRLSIHHYRPERRLTPTVEPTIVAICSNFYLSYTATCVKQSPFVTPFDGCLIQVSVYTSPRLYEYFSMWRLYADQWDKATRKNVEAGLKIIKSGSENQSGIFSFWLDNMKT